MALLIYAAPADLTAWLGVNAPANASALLRAGTFVVADACARNPYTDAPSPAQLAVLLDATCAQAASWIALGIDPAALGLDTAPVKRTTLLDASVEQDTTGRVSALQMAASELAPQARHILTAAGAIWLPVPYSDESGGHLPSWGQGHSAWEATWPGRDPLSGEISYPYLPAFP